MDTGNFEMGFSIRHAGCYSDGFNSQFPGISVECFNMQFVGGQAVDLFRISGSPSAFGRITNYLRKHPTVSQVRVLEETGKELYLKVKSRQVGRIKTVSEVVFTSDCYCVKQLAYEANREVWTIGSDSKAKLAAATKRLKKLGEVKILYVKKTGFRDFLTRQERNALLTAKILGYYEWPRLVGVREIAKELGIGKTALLHALRHAEAKLIAKYL